MQYDRLASNESINSTVANLAEHNIEGIVVDTKEAALAKVKELIPAGSSVMNGASVTLEQIGFIDYLKSGGHGWDNLHEAIVKETDPSVQGTLRQQALHSSYYLGSIHALSETGEFIVASNTGSQLPHIVFTSSNLIFVVGSQKIVSNLVEAIKRLEEYVVPLENKQSMVKWGGPTQLNKIVIFKGENPHMGRKVRVIIVKESLGF
jgi:hypothetical protein